MLVIPFIRDGGQGSFRNFAQCPRDTLPPYFCTASNVTHVRHESLSLRQKSPGVFITHLRTPGVARFMTGVLTTADLGARFLLAKNLCERASLGWMRFSTFMWRVPLRRSAKSLSSATLGPP